MVYVWWLVCNRPVANTPCRKPKNINKLCMVYDMPIKYVQFRTG